MVFTQEFRDALRMALALSMELPYFEQYDACVDAISGGLSRAMTDAEDRHVRLFVLCVPAPRREADEDDEARSEFYDRQRNVYDDYDEDD